MKKVLLLLACFYCINIMASDFKFGLISITPYTIEQTHTSPLINETLEFKMSQILLNHSIAPDRSDRFIIVPHIYVENIGTTATIPSKTSVKILISFAIGDGVTGVKFSNYAESLTGVGRNKDEAILSAIRKVKVSGNDIDTFIKVGSTRIVEYYNTCGKSLLQQAQASITSENYEQAIKILATIPSFCSYYDEAQTLLINCGGQIIKRDNERYLREAQTAWSADPSTAGAEIAKSFLLKIVNPSPSIIKRIASLNHTIEKAITENERRKHDLEMAKLMTQAEIQEAEIQASASIASSFFTSIPKLLINVLSWF